MSPKELDQQCPIIIDRWLSVDSQEWRELDPDPGLTKKMLRICFDADAIETDSLGRVWSKPTNPQDIRRPFHFNVGKKLYGIRLATKAAN
jgi:hypothetical protein